MILDIHRESPKPGITVLTLKGSIHSGPNCMKLEQEISSLLQGGVLRIVLDFSEVGHIDSSAIGSLVRSFMKVKAAGGMMRLAGVKGMLEGTFKITKVDQVMKIYPTPQAASEDFA